MLVQSFTEEDHHFASSKYGQDWAGPDGDRLTLALSLMKQLPPFLTKYTSGHDSDCDCPLAFSEKSRRKSESD